MLPTVLAGLALVGCGATTPPAAPTVPTASTVAPVGVAAAGAVGTTAPAQVAPPSRIRLPSLGVDAPVVAVGVDGRGEMAVPENVREAGWYRFGPAPGATSGSSVVAGHVDDRVQGRGAFYRLVDLAVGDPAVVTTAAGAELAFRVSAVRRIPKSALPVDELFARDGPPHLTLVTCGGAFDRAIGSYRDNVVVTATPVT